MDLRLFHPTGFPNRKFKSLDFFNSWTRLQPCRFLEWTGWYNFSVPQRLLGHYRLYQLYKKNHRGSPNDIPPIHGYILQYQIWNGIKYRLWFFMAHLYSVWGYPERDMEIYAINRILIHDRNSILYDFLTNAETQFEEAYRHALQQIYAPEFLSPVSIPKTSSTKIIVQVKHDHNTTTNYNNTSYSHNELNIHPVIKEEITISQPVSSTPTKEVLRGKEKGVFSKKLVLLLFDLLAQAAKIERIDLSRPNKFDAIAQLLQAITGKGKNTWLEELNDHRNKDLYEYHTPGELDQLLRTLINLSKTLHDAGFRSLSSLADKKIRELEAKK